MKNKILISKEILRIDYLSCYGGQLWSTPNIDDLASKGTIFKRHYTSAPSTAMSISSMFTGKYPYQLNRKIYKNEQIQNSKYLQIKFLKTPNRKKTNTVQNLK